MRTSYLPPTEPHFDTLRALEDGSAIVGAGGNRTFPDLRLVKTESPAAFVESDELFEELRALEEGCMVVGAGENVDSPIIADDVEECASDNGTDEILDENRWKKLVCLLDHHSAVVARELRPDDPMSVGSLAIDLLNSLSHWTGYVRQRMPHLLPGVTTLLLGLTDKLRESAMLARDELTQFMEAEVQEQFLARRHHNAMARRLDDARDQVRELLQAWDAEYRTLADPNTKHRWALTQKLVA